MVMIFNAQRAPENTKCVNNVNKKIQNRKEITSKYVENDHNG